MSHLGPNSHCVDAKANMKPVVCRFIQLNCKMLVVEMKRSPRIIQSVAASTSLLTVHHKRLYLTILSVPCKKYDYYYYYHYIAQTYILCTCDMSVPVFMGKQGDAALLSSER